MIAMSYEAPDQEGELSEIGQLLGKAVRERRRRDGRLMQPDDQTRIQEALQAVLMICDRFHEVTFEQVHSVRVRQITADFESLRAMMCAFGGRELTGKDQTKVRARIKTWHHESRRWVAELPMQAVVKQLPEKDGLANPARINRLKACWLEAGAACFAPPPRRPGTMAQWVPDHFQIAPLGLPVDWCMDSMDAEVADTERPKWECRPPLVTELLDWAQEALLLEVGGSDRGGKTTFAQRCRQSSLRDALAFSCLLVYEGVVGPKSARQSQSGCRTGLPGTLFERFVSKVYAMAIGSEIPKDWALGPDPIRKAIATQRTWQKLFKAAGTSGPDEFNALPLDVQVAAKARLKQRDRERLRPSALPWV